MFCRSLFVLLFIVLSVPFRFKDSDYPFGIFKLFFREIQFEYTIKVIAEIVNELYLDSPLLRLVLIDLTSKIVDSTGHNLILDSMKDSR